MNESFAQNFHEIALAARTGLRETLKIVQLHASSQANAALNPGMLITAVATWERFMADLAAAATYSDWCINQAGFYRYYDRSGWPGRQKDSSSIEDACDLLINEGLLQAPLTNVWNVRLATSWRGSQPTRWREVQFSPDDGNEVLSALMGSKTARDAAAHRIPYKKAIDARGGSVRSNGEVCSEGLTWTYPWESDNVVKSRDGRPTIQHGYVRSVLALFIQIIDSSIAEISRQNVSTSGQNNRLPAAWFKPIMPTGHPCGGMTLWNGVVLIRS